MVSALNLPRLRAGFLAALLTVAVGIGPAASAPPRDLPLPRFVSLRAATVNLRAGPGVQYPVEWVLKRRDLPVEIIAVFGPWRKVRDQQGTVGWVHQSLLSGRRMVVIVGAVRDLRKAPEEAARPILRAEPGVQGKLLSCRAAWCRIEISDRAGWIRRDHLWGVYPGETIGK